MTAEVVQLLALETHGSVDFNGAVMIAVAIVRMVQVTSDDVVHVISVWNRLVTAIRPVIVVTSMVVTAVIGSTLVRVRIVDVQFVLIDMIIMDVVKMTIMEVVPMISMLDSLVSATFSVLMLMFIVNFTVHF